MLAPQNDDALKPQNPGPEGILLLLRSLTQLPAILRGDGAIVCGLGVYFLYAQRVTPEAFQSVLYVVACV